MDPSVNVAELFLKEYVLLGSKLSNPAQIKNLPVVEQLELYQKELEVDICNHDQEIEQMCSAHYKIFIDCIQELLLVRPSAEGLKKETIEINSELTKSSETIQRKAEELIKARRILVNSSSSIDLISKCIFVLEQYSKFNEQIAEKKYFPALKTLEALDSQYLPSVMEHKFAQSMREQIPKYKNAIKEATTKDLNDFLEGLLIKSQEIGEIVLRSSVRQLNFEDYDLLFLKDNHNHISDSSSFHHSSQYNNNKSTSSSPTKKKSSKTKRAPQPPSSANERSPSISSSTSVSKSSYLETRRDSDKSVTDVNFLSLIDFCPVYRGLHIFSSLGVRDEFDSYYKKQRQEQSKLAFIPPSHMSQSVFGYHDYFSSVVGFFVIEDHLMGTTTNFITPEYLNERWDSCIELMTNSMNQQVKLCSDSSLMLKIKKLIMLFIFTIRNYGHKTEALGGILLIIRQQYNNILKRQWKDKFEEIFRIDNYHPLEITNMEEYMQIIGEMSVFKTESVKFPRNFPFSISVPKIYEEVRSFIEQSLRFSHDLNSSQADVEDMVRNSTNQLLTEVLGCCLTSLINSSNLNLLQLIQITINTEYLEKAVQDLDHHIKYQVSKSMSGFGEGVHEDQVKLRGESMFKDAKAEAESQIYKKINDKIDDIFSLASYDWTMAEANGKPSSFISDLIAWLRTTFVSFTNLPPRIAQGACMSACKHLAISLHDMLLSEENKSLSLGGLTQFNLDLMQCETFANSEPVQGFKDGDLLMAFAELRQICDLFIQEDYCTYIADMGKQQNKYLRVTSATALTICEKLREFDRKRNFIALTRNEKQKVRDSFIKSLRQQSLQNQQ